MNKGLTSIEFNYIADNILFKKWLLIPRKRISNTIE